MGYTLQIKMPMGKEKSLPDMMLCSRNSMGGGCGSDSS